ncbi:MAG: hypothetical protein JNL75_03315 [Chitinophagales bacterium]|nr:hypothetical protein [Chitinophagales bacterium]
MQVLIEKLKMPWSFMRVIRLLLGILLLVQGILAHQWMVAMLGFGFALMPLWNLGCGCEGSACTYSPKENKTDD